MNEKLKFFLITPTFNRKELLEKAILSIINQKKDYNFDYEYIIVDDGSTDGTKEYIQKYLDNNKNIKYFYQENGGVGKARNLGIEQALNLSKNKNDYIIFLDDDDKLINGAFNNIYKIIINTKFKSIYSFSCQDQYGNKITNYKKEFNNNLVDPLELLCSNTGECFGVTKLNIFKNTKYRYREDINGGEIYLFMTIGEDYKYYVIDKIFRVYVINSHNSLINISEINENKLNNYIYDYKLSLNLFGNKLKDHKKYNKKYGEILLVLARFIALKNYKVDSLKYFFEGLKYNRNIKYILLYFISFIDYRCILYNIILKYVK